IFYGLRVAVLIERKLSGHKYFTGIKYTAKPFIPNRTPGVNHCHEAALRTRTAAQSRAQVAVARHAVALGEATAPAARRVGDVRHARSDSAEGLANATLAPATPLADALYSDADAPPVVRCLKEERAVSETASVVLRTCVLVAEDTPEFGCSPHPAALHCSLCAEDECNAAAPLALLPPPLLVV
ncbi:Protein of unknown function, partial [Gryllus bimaculatus]